MNWRTGGHFSSSFISRRIGFVAVLLCAAWPNAALLADDPSRGEVNFGRDIRPLLSDTCFVCHGPDEATRDSELRFDSREGAFVDLGGYQAIVPGEPEKSELIARITSDDEGLRMPPPDAKRQLTDEQIALLKRWIEQGAEWEEHWSFVPPKKETPPSLSKLKDWPKNAIDHFVAARLENEKLSPSDEAAKETLIRRVTLDLTGLPPTLEEVDAFLADNSPDAYERLVDRLLASPRYGEHMAAAWLNAARYSDTNGYQQDRTRTMWPWRDWVIHALNRNMPFDQFTVEQLAGDLLPDATQQTRLASGFNRNHPLNGEGGRIAEESRVEYVVDRVETTSTVWLGLTAGCARCHDHKYDPLSQQEFYNLYAFFNSIDESGRVDAGGNAKPVMKLPTPQQLERQQELSKEIEEVEQKLKRPPDATKFAQWRDQLRRKIDGQEIDFVWLPTEPVKFSSDNGQTLELWDDGSIYVSGKNPDNDSYTVILQTDANEIRGLRLEGLAHESFTNGGIARSNSGNFVLTEMEITVRRGDGEPQRVKVKSAQADFEQGGWPVKNAFDGNPNTGWAVYNPSNMKVDRAAKFLFEQPITGGEGTIFTVRLKHDSVHQFHNLGRFRLSLTTHENPPLREEESDVPATIVAAINTPADKRSDTQQRQLADYYRREAAEFADRRKQLTDVKKQLADLEKSFPEVMVMSQRSQPRETFVLKVGQYDQPDRNRPASPNTPAVLPLLPEDKSHDRLALAQWLVDPAHPLTARVTVNRIWQHHFGTGLVKTTEDFGVQGERPSHPELLDWLAVHFIESGWNVKQLHKLIVMSATYQQSSAMTPDLRERDPANRLLARGPRFRLSSFAIRDQALSLAGILVEKVGGEPVKPYQPPGVWDDFSLGKIKYQRDTGEKLYRRSLYTFWRRSVAPTTLFDTANRLVCDVRPRRTNTPLHALTTLNDEAFVEAARLFAERMMVEGGDSPEDRIRWAFRLATSRKPSDDETAILLRSWERANERFTSDEESAKQLLSVGEKRRNEELPAAGLAAYTSIANMLLNLDEVLTRE